MNNEEEKKGSFMEYHTSILIQSVKPKNFQFNFLGYDSVNLPNNSYRDSDRRWKPVLNYKKLYSQPKFIMSLQRKKQRIISGIRDRQVQPQQQKMVGPAGSKVRTYKRSQKKSLANISQDSQRFNPMNETSWLKNQLKKKKNPYMNFSLMYISQRKKNLKLQVQHKEKSQAPRIQTATSRQKGSNSAYMHMIMNESSSRKQRARPRTSCYSERYRKLQQTRSQFFEKS